MSRIDCSVRILDSLTLQDVHVKTALELDKACTDGNGRPAWALRISGAIVGYISEADMERAMKLEATAGEDLMAMVRSVRRSPGSQDVSAIQVRLAASQLPLARHGAAGDVPKAILEAPELEDLARNGERVTRAQLEAVAGDAEIRAELARPEVQRLIAAVDTAPAREAALTAALGNARLAGVCERLLDVVSQ